jgi:cyanophycinase-like exopeptidase
LKKKHEATTPGQIVLFGSGEASPAGRKVWEQALRALPKPPRLVLLETPAGFEPNSDRVIGKVGEFVAERLQNYHPEIRIAPARRKGGPNSTDDPAMSAALLDSDLIFMGPGSPTYAVRQLRDSLAWQRLQACHRLGAVVALASAAAIAVSSYSLPVYEIYKVGEDLHWKPGLDLFGQFGLPLVFVPHWNNNDGGDELDTSRCFMGQARFAELMDMLPAGLTVIGIDEKTALTMDVQNGLCRVEGAGGVTLIHTGHGHELYLGPELVGAGLHEVAAARDSHVHLYNSGETFPLSDCCPFTLPQGGAGLPEAVWAEAVEAERRMKAERAEAALKAASGPEHQDVDAAPAAVQALVEDRRMAREQKRWADSDAIRDRIAALGWKVVDTKEGQKLVRGE